MAKYLKRQSEIELFRIVSMFLVLVVHADFFSLGRPTTDLLLSNPMQSFGQLLFQGLSIGCVDIFILISGWFGITPKIKSFLKFVFQCVFFLGGIYAVVTLCGLTDLSVKGILRGVAGCLLLLKWDWFINAYICLYIIAPMINIYVKNVDRKSFANLLIYFFVFQSIYSWISDAASFFESGYSTMSFIGLYMLARYFKLYSPRYSKLNIIYYLWIYVVIVVILVLSAYWAIMNNHSFLLGKIYSYVNPLVILSSLSLLLFFSKLRIRSSFINWIGASSFAVYLLHYNSNLCLQYFVPTVKYIVQNNTGYLVIVYLFLFLALIFVVAILLDQIRIYLWNKLVMLF